MTIGKRGKKAGIILGVVVALIVAASVTSWIRTDPVEQVAFFEPRAGERSPLVFAHQGGEGIRPSNTMIAFTHSADLGADVLDADVHMTSDGILVLIHDETVDRTSDGSGEVRSMTLADLRELDFGYRFTTDGGATYPYRGQGHGIVTLEELFARFEGYRFGLEIKQATQDAAAEMCRLIRRFGYEQDVLLSSFGQENMDLFREECPDVATSATEGEVRRFYIFHRLGLIGLVSPAYQSLQVPEERDGFRILSDGFVDDAEARGMAIVPWTINETDDFDRILAFEPFGINTDYPDRLIDHLG